MSVINPGMKKLNIILAGVIALAEMVIGTRGELPKALKENVVTADASERAAGNDDERTKSGTNEKQEKPPIQ